MNAKDSSSACSDTLEQDKQVWFDCKDYQQLIEAQLRYLRNELSFSPVYPDEFQLQFPSILQYLLHLTEKYRLFIVYPESSFLTETLKERKSIMAFGLKEHFIERIQAIDLCICDCSENVFYCSYQNHPETCSTNIPLLKHFLQKFNEGLNPKLYNFIFENCYYITAVDLTFLDRVQHSNNPDDETLEAVRLQNPTRILPNLYLSSQTPAKNFTLLKQLHIRYILNLTGFKSNTNELRFELHYPPEFTTLHIPIADEMDVNILDHFEQALRFISRCIDHNDPNSILVHCEAGISRSSTIVIAYLMQYHHHSLKSAYEFVQQRKNNIDPNINFFKQLIEFEKRMNKDKENFQPSFNLQDYIVQYMIKGPAAGFSREQILKALEKTNNDTHAACSLLFSTM